MSLLFPFVTHTWRVSHHWGIITPSLLYQFLRAASLHQNSRDPAQKINNYLATNELVPPNIRTDSRQSDVWRDYQQILTELGLLFPTRSYGIRFTQAGLSYLDGTIPFTDLLTTQAFRWQFPNGHNRQRSRNEPSRLSFHTQQAENGVSIRPALLLWQLLFMLREAGEREFLSNAEIGHFAMPALRNDQVGEVFDSIVRARREQSAEAIVTEFRQRNVTDAITFLSHSSAFVGLAGGLGLSSESIENISSINVWMKERSNSARFWSIPRVEEETIDSWFNFFGTLDAEIIPIQEKHDDFGYEAEPEDETSSTTNEIVLREFLIENDDAPRASSASRTISAAYSADLSESAHRQHDAMVKLIAEVSKTKDATVSFDPATLDLLIMFRGTEFLIEVKSASARNLHNKLRLAIGQVSYYDFLRSKQTGATRRKAVALTLSLDGEEWVADFLNNHLDIDLLSLQNGALNLASLANISQELFS